MTISRTNLAALIEGPGKVRVDEAPTDSPGENEVLLKVHAVAVNPVDSYRQKTGLFIDTYPWIVGCDGAGIVEEVGPGVKHVKPGDRVVASANEFYCHKSTHAMFQQYVTVSADGCCTIPDTMKFTDASVLPLGLTTAAGMLYESVTLSLKWPDLSIDVDNSQEVLIVWGGSSSVGACAIQLAKASGYRVVSIASKHNYGLMTQCGSDANFDYKSQDMIDSLCKFVGEKGWNLAGIAAAIMGEEVFKACGEIARRLPGNKFVSTSLARGISPEPDMPEGVKASNCKAKSRPFRNFTDYEYRLRSQRARCSFAYLE